MSDDKERKALYEKRIKEAYSRLQRQAEREARMAAIAKSYLEPTAYERLMNVRLSNPDLYAKVINILATHATSIGRKLTEKELLTILTQLTRRREPRIYIKRSGGFYGKHKRGKGESSSGKSQETE